MTSEMFSSSLAVWYWFYTQQRSLQGQTSDDILSLLISVFRQDLPVQCNQLWGDPHLLGRRPPQVRGGEHHHHHHYHLGRRVPKI